MHTHIQIVFVLISKQEMMMMEKSHYKSFVTGNFCCWSEVLFSAKHMKNNLSPANLYFDWYQEHALLYFRVDSQPV